MADLTDIIDTAKKMKANDYRGPFAWARKVIDYVADLSAPTAAGAPAVTEREFYPMAWRVSFNEGKTWTVYEWDPTGKVANAVVQPLILGADVANNLFIEARCDGPWLVCIGKVHSTEGEARAACVALQQSTLPTATLYARASLGAAPTAPASASAPATPAPTAGQTFTTTLRKALKRTDVFTLRESASLAAFDHDNLTRHGDSDSVKFVSEYGDLSFGPFWLDQPVEIEADGGSSITTRYEGGKENDTYKVWFERRVALQQAHLADPELATPSEPPINDEALWDLTCNAQGWNKESQIIHLEGFIRERGLMGELGAYAAAAAEEENS